MLMEGILNAILTWTVLSFITSVFHHFNFYKLDRYLCVKCFSFWFTLIITRDIYSASIAALCGYILDKYINSVDIKL